MAEHVHVHHDESDGEAAPDDGALSDGEQALMMEDAVAGDAAGAGAADAGAGGGEEAALLPSDDEADEPEAGAAAGEVRLHDARPSFAGR